MNEKYDNIEQFWSDCEAKLAKYMAEFNNKMGVVGLQVEYIIVDKNLLRIGYGLKMCYKEIMLHHADILVCPMHIPAKTI